MTLRELIEKLEGLRSEHGENIDVEFTIPAHEGSYAVSYTHLTLPTRCSV